MRTIAAAAAFAVASSAIANAVHDTDRELASRLDGAIDAAIAERRIVGTVVLVMRNGKLVYRRAAGWADRENKVRMQEDAVFLLASVTKPIVAAAAMRLVEQGILKLDDPVTRWLPQFAPKAADGTTPVIRVHHLLTHTAGLTYDFLEQPDGAYHRLGVSSGLDRPGLSLDENLKRIAAAPLLYTPGTGWSYSVSMDVLGAVLERAAGRPLPEIVRSLVTQPLRMNDTGFRVTDPARLVAHYGDGTPEPRRMRDEDQVSFNGNAVRFAPGRLFNPKSYPSGGAGMAGTAADILTFLEALRTGGSILRPETVANMMRAHADASAQTQGPGWGFGYGGAVLVDPAAAGVAQSKGTMQWGGAYGHNWFIDPEKRLTVVALTNTTFEGMVGKFTVDVRTAVYGE